MWQGSYRENIPDQRPQRELPRAGTAQGPRRARHDAKRAFGLECYNKGKATAHAYLFIMVDLVHSRLEIYLPGLHHLSYTNEIALPRCPGSVTCLVDPTESRDTGKTRRFAFTCGKFIKFITCGLILGNI